MVPHPGGGMRKPGNGAPPHAYNSAREIPPVFKSEPKLTGLVSHGAGRSTVTVSGKAVDLKWGRPSTLHLMSSHSITLAGAVHAALVSVDGATG